MLTTTCVWWGLLAKLSKRHAKVKGILKEKTSQRTTLGISGLHNGGPKKRTHGSGFLGAFLGGRKKRFRVRFTLPSDEADQLQTSANTTKKFRKLKQVQCVRIQFT